MLFSHPEVFNLRSSWRLMSIVYEFKSSLQSFFFLLERDSSKRLQTQVTISASKSWESPWELADCYSYSLSDTKSDKSSKIYIMRPVELVQNTFYADHFVIYMMYSLCLSVRDKRLFKMKSLWNWDWNIMAVISKENPEGE